MEDIRQIIKDAIEETREIADTRGYGSKELTIDGIEYSLMCSKSSAYEVHLWSEGGRTSLVGNASIDEAVDACVEAIEKWQQGFIHCSDCGKWVKYSDNSGRRYFAGIYCQDCWERKWREVEARETYE